MPAKDNDDVAELIISPGITNLLNTLRKFEEEDIMCSKRISVSYSKDSPTIEIKGSHEDVPLEYFISDCLPKKKTKRVAVLKVLKAFCDRELEEQGKIKNGKYS